MRIRFNHYFGTQSQIDLIAYTAVLECQPGEESQALDQGWLYSNKQWYQCRSTRLRLDAGILDQGWDHRFSWSVTENSNIAALQLVYDDYITHKGFTKNFDLSTDIGRTAWLEVRHNSELIAFTKLLSFDGGLISDINAYSLAVKRFGIGKKMLRLEAQIAQDKGLKYLYLGPGYERSCAYKADLPGFEWWSGDNWSSDRTLYRQLCNIDSTVTDLATLSTLYRTATK